MKMTRRTFALSLATAVGLGVAACSPGSGDDAASSTGRPSQSGPGTASSPSQDASGSADVEVIAQGLDVPWSLVFHGDTAILSERDSARILELLEGGSTREVGVVAGVTASGEAGLLGLALREGTLYAYSTGEDENRVQRFELTGAPGSFSLGEPETILDGLPRASWHDGGRIAFGPDGMLYVTVGDTYRPESAQDLSAMSGKILRLTPDGGVPEDNPFDGSYVYSYGHRNPQGLAWGPDGTMYSTEFGQDTWDELNVIQAGGNYGWPTVEGIGGDDRFIDPVQQWHPADASPSGITVADGSLWIANLRGERLRQVPLDDLGSSTEYLTGEYGRLRHVTEAPDGSLWVLTSNTDGNGEPGPDDDRILRMQPS